MENSDSVDYRLLNASVMISLCGFFEIYSGIIFVSTGSKEQGKSKRGCLK